MKAIYNFIASAKTKKGHSAKTYDYGTGGQGEAWPNWMGEHWYQNLESPASESSYC